MYAHKDYFELDLVIHPHHAEERDREIDSNTVRPIWHTQRTLCDYTSSRLGHEKRCEYEDGSAKVLRVTAVTHDDGIKYQITLW